MKAVEPISQGIFTGEPCQGMFHWIKTVRLLIKGGFTKIVMSETFSLKAKANEIVFSVGILNKSKNCIFGLSFVKNCKTVRLYALLKQLYENLVRF